MSNNNATNKIKINEKFFLSKIIEKIDFKNKRVFLRADLNVPIDKENEKILNDYKLKATLPTINLLLKHGAKIVLATHIGEPVGQNAISSQILVDFFQKHNIKTIFEKDIKTAIEKSTSDKEYQILLLENLRLFPGEKSKILEEKIELAKSLQNLGDYYVNDAFGVMHKHDTSITILPTLFDKNKIFLGLLAEKELTMLQKLASKPKAGFTVIIGGGKLETKIPLIENILDKIDNLILCPAINFPFMKYFDDNIGKSLFYKNMLPFVPKIIEEARKKHVKISYPIDFIVAKDSFDGPIYDIDKPEIPDNFVGLAIGPKSAKLFTEIVKHSKTIFFNGVSGNINKEKSLDGVKTIFSAMSHKGAFSVIGGGDSVAVANMLNMTKDIDYLSTAGGASLAFLGFQKLPGLIVFE